MQAMPRFPNGFVWQDEDDIHYREFLIQRISSRLRADLCALNPAIDMMRVETPCLVPADFVKAHQAAEFPVYSIGGEDGLYLRPESTSSTYAMFRELFPKTEMLQKRLPFCIWQANMSFREEQDKTFKNLRFKQFWQMEFQLAYREGTKADYHQWAVKSLYDLFATLFQNRELRLDKLAGESLPFYSSRTTDIYLDQWEVVAISDRKDFDFPILEVSCGLDRLVALIRRTV